MRYLTRARTGLYRAKPFIYATRTNTRTQRSNEIPFLISGARRTRTRRGEIGRKIRRGERDPPDLFRHYAARTRTQLNSVRNCARARGAGGERERERQRKKMEEEGRNKKKKRQINRFYGPTGGRPVSLIHADESRHRLRSEINKRSNYIYL